MVTAYIEVKRNDHSEVVWACILIKCKHETWSMIPKKTLR